MGDIMPVGYCSYPGCDYILDKVRIDGRWSLMQSSVDHLAEHDR